MKANGLTIILVAIAILTALCFTEGGRDAMIEALTTIAFLGIIIIVGVGGFIGYKLIFKK